MMELRKFGIIGTAFALVLAPTSSRGCPDKCLCTSTAVKCKSVYSSMTSLPDLDKDIDHLVVNSQSLTTISAEDFEGKENLRFLDLSYNRIVSVGHNAFGNLKQLKFLNLRDNILSTLFGDSFSGLTSLQTLKLLNNNLISISQGVFSNLSSLHYLDLSSNNINDISSSSLVGLRSLTVLNLNQNNLRKFPKNALEPLTALEELHLSGNQITMLPNYALSKQGDLKSLYVGGNNLAYIEDFALSSNRKLKNLDLGNNHLEEFPKRLICSLPALQDLDMSSNLMSKIGSDSVRCAANLQKIKISNCQKLKSVESKAFSGAFLLNHIDLNYNPQLNSIHMFAFEGLSNLNSVSLRGNALEVIDEELLVWGNIDTLDLQDNPWRCDCHLVWMTDMFRAHNSNMTGVYAEATRCNQPREVFGRTIKLLPHESFRCDHIMAKQRLIKGAVTAACVLVFVSSLCILFFLRHRISDCCRRRVAYKIFQKPIGDMDDMPSQPYREVAEEEPGEESVGNSHHDAL